MLAPILALFCTALFCPFAPSVIDAPHDPERRLAEVSARLLLHPGDPALWLERGRLRHAMGDDQAALSDLQAVLRLEPRHTGAMVAMASVQQRLGNPVAALVTMRKAQANGASGPVVDRLRGRILVALHRPAEAAAALAAALAATARPQPEQFLELAATLALEGDGVSAALAVLERGITMLGPVVGLVDAAVALDLRAGAFDRALARLEPLRAHMACTVPLHQRRARVLMAAGRPGEVALEQQLERAARDTEVALRATTVSAAVVAPAAPIVLPPAPAPVPASTSLVPAGSVWRYLDSNVAPAGNWQSPGFDDSAWASGPAQLGYGDGDEATVIASGPAGAHHTASWFRHTFTVADPTLFPTARVRLLCDDGALVYVNGVEIARWNLHNGPIPPSWWASVAMAGADESAFRTFAFPVSLLVAGANVVAVQVHQVSPTSSDVSFDLELVAGSEPVTIVRGPYVQNGTPTSAIVQWRTDQPSATQLWLGSSATTLQPAFFDPTLRTDHAALASGLQPETLYHYRVGDAVGMVPGQSSAQTFRTLPPPGAVRPLRVWTFGDAGFGSSSQFAVRDVYAALTAGTPADAMLMLGDNAYYIGTDAEYQVGVFDVYGSQMRSTFCWSTLGNHDAVLVDTPNQSGPYYDIFSLPKAGEAGGLPSGTEAYYSFDRGHVHFVCLDSMDSDRTATGAMMTWLSADLASTTAHWIIAFFHHPPYTFGSHHSDDPADSGGRMDDMRTIALPILEAGGVDLVLAGHSHDYERSFLLDGHYGQSTTLQPGMVLDQGDGRVQGDGAYGKATVGPAPHEGAVYVVAGSAGSTSGGPLDHPAMYIGLNRLGSMVLDIDGDRLDAMFLGLGGIEDQFTLVKGESRTLFRDQPRISVGAGGRQDFRLVAGPQDANHWYLLIGSFGSDPGFGFDGVQIPLLPDAWMQLTLGLANSPFYPNSLGFLDATGRATAAFVLPPLTDPTLAGLVLHHAYIVGGSQGLTMASNAVKVTLLP